MIIEVAAGSIIVKELEQSHFSDSKAIAIIDDDENKKYEASWSTYSRKQV